MYKWLIIILTVGLFSCSPVKYITEYKETIKIDTLYTPKLIEVEVKVPYEVVREVVPSDSTSYLQTSVAQSWASINNGLLDHKLENKNTSLKGDTIVVEKEIYIDREIIDKQTEIVEKKVTPIWNWIIMTILGCCIIYLIFKR